MKLRIKGNSLRLRISQTDMTKLLREGCVEETICFGTTHDAQLTYALTAAEAAEDLRLDYRTGRVTVALSAAAAQRWAAGNEVGIYGSVETVQGPLELMVEKDFACLDGDDPRDADAFPNPNAATVC